MEAAVFQPLIPQNYSSDQAGSALRGCRGHTTQPRGQPANYRPPCPTSLSPPRRRWRWGNEGKKPERKRKENIDSNVKKSTVSLAELCTPFPFQFSEGRESVRLWFAASRSHPSQWKKLRPMGLKLGQCMWVYISACCWLHTWGLSQCLLPSLCLRNFPKQGSPPSWPYDDTQWGRRGKSKCCVLISSGLTFGRGYWLNGGLEGRCTWVTVRSQEHAHTKLLLYEAAGSLITNAKASQPTQEINQKKRTLITCRNSSFHTCDNAIWFKCLAPGCVNDATQGQAEQPLCHHWNNNTLTTKQFSYVQSLGVLMHVAQGQWVLRQLRLFL